MHSPLTIGVMGCAQIAERSVIPAIMAHDAFQLVGVSSRNETKANAFAAQFSTTAYVGYDALLADDTIDVIYMPLPTGLHAEWIEKCLNAGKHVLCEKSLTSTYAEAQKVIALAQDKDLLLQEDFMFAHHAQMAFILDQLHSGAIGELRLVRSAFGFPPFGDTDNIRYKKELGGGALLDAGGYPTKVAQLVLGHNLRVAGASLWASDAHGVDIHGSAQLVRPDGVSAQIAFGFDNAYKCELELWGSQGTLLAPRIFTPKPDFAPEVVITRNNERTVHSIAAHDHFASILTHFAHTLHAGDFAPIYNELTHQARLLSEVRAQAQ